VSFFELCDFWVLYIGVLLWFLYDLITITWGLTTELILCVVKQKSSNSDKHYWTWSRYWHF